LGSPFTAELARQTVKHSTHRGTMKAKLQHLHVYGEKGRLLHSTAKSNMSNGKW